MLSFYEERGSADVPKEVNFWAETAVTAMSAAKNKNSLFTTILNFTKLTRPL